MTQSTENLAARPIADAAPSKFKQLHHVKIINKIISNKMCSESTNSAKAMLCRFLYRMKCPSPNIN